MLHGCTQSPDDFAAGTRMNETAEAAGCFVAYPGQTALANHSKCWNWFNPEDQRRGGGEPSLIAGITRAIMGEYAIDPRRVYIAGLSAGGAAAVILASTYPELFAAVGVHSGLACGAAHDMTSAFRVMRSGPGARSGPGRAPARPDGSAVPSIVFHGDRDDTVHASNADVVVAQLAGTGASRLEKVVLEGRVPGGHAFTRTVRSLNGRTVSEQWVVHGAGHSWSGGSPAGSVHRPQRPGCFGGDAAVFPRTLTPVGDRPPHQVTPGRLGGPSLTGSSGRPIVSLSEGCPGRGLRYRRSVHPTAAR